MMHAATRTIRHALVATMLLHAAGCAPIEGGEPQAEADLADAGVLEDKQLPSASYQAENRTSQSGCSVDTKHAGYSGAGFVDFGGNGTWIEWNNIAAPLEGVYELSLRYANASSSSRSAAVLVNGQSTGSRPFASTGAWSTWRNESVRVTLRRGNNTVRVLANTSAGGPNVDRMDVRGVDLCPSDPNKVEPEACGCGVPEGSCNPPPGAVGLRKPSGTKLRIASYNVLRDSVFDGARKEAFARIAPAVDADVWCMQEVSYGEDPAPVSEAEQWRSRMKEITGRDWSYAWDREGRYLLSRHPVRWNAALHHRVHATWIDLPSSVSSTDLVVVNVHLAPGGTGENARRDQASKAVDFIKAVQAGSYAAAGTRIPRDASIVVCGDFNASPNSRPYKIIHSLDTRFKSDSFNQSYTPQMTDTRPKHISTDDISVTHGTVTFKAGTWSVSGGTIDYVVHRSSTLTAHNSFILNTLILAPEELRAMGLLQKDVAIDPRGSVNTSDASVSLDHLPIIVDFRAR